jgi:hypothetical protein
MLRYLLAFFLALLPFAAQAATLDEILTKVDANMTYDTRESLVKMTVTKGGRSGGRVPGAGARQGHEDVEERERPLDVAPGRREDAEDLRAHAPAEHDGIGHVL